MIDQPAPPLPSTDWRRRLARGLFRSLIATAALTVLYFLSPLDRMTKVPLGASLAVALVVLFGVTIWQIRTIMRSAYPGVRAIEALIIIVPLFVFLFAATYFLTAQADPTNFSIQPLTRTDTLYFTLTVLATVGFGDITATSQSARLLVSAQMVLDLLLLGFGIRVFLGAVKRGRQRQAPDAEGSLRPGPHSSNDLDEAT